MEVTFGGNPIPHSPFQVTVAAPMDLDKVTVDNLDGRTQTLFSSDPHGRVCTFILKEPTVFQGWRLDRSSSSR